MTQLRTWQRRHADGVVAEVCPVPGIGTWEASARLLTSGAERHADLQFSLLTDAQNAADVLACAMLPHDCGGSCEPWAAVERRRTTR